jgi:hypothetical protein
MYISWAHLSPWSCTVNLRMGCRAPTCGLLQPKGSKDMITWEAARKSMNMVVVSWGGEEYKTMHVALLPLLALASPGSPFLPSLSPIVPLNFVRSVRHSDFKSCLNNQLFLRPFERGCRLFIVWFKSLNVLILCRPLVAARAPIFLCKQSDRARSWWAEIRLAASNGTVQ